VSPDPKSALPDPPRLPERAAIYLAPDGTVRFGALFAGLLPVAEALSGRPFPAQREDRGSPERTESDGCSGR
jgi:hypothetical protein